MVTTDLVEDDVILGNPYQFRFNLTAGIIGKIVNQSRTDNQENDKRRQQYAEKNNFSCL